MKKFILLFMLALGLAINVKAMTYEEAFDSIKAIPNMKGVQGTLISGGNDFASLGITDGQLILWDGETGLNKETAVYGNTLYRIMGQLPVSEMVQGLMNDQTIFSIFATPISADKNRILILSDSAADGFTGALIGYINNKDLAALRQAILIPAEAGGTAVYLKALKFRRINKSHVGFIRHKKQRSIRILRCFVCHR